MVPPLRHARARLAQINSDFELAAAAITYDTDNGCGKN